ncbi:family 20 glycosylhydrolase [uncultured Dokdonia sp.]|uniref:family 20 glycosylhydrolase n=1 Tax=uncultured Dokdonia sp. TaxID=575653 RepID=UPI0030EDEA2C|tara:strand:+ start:60321 stop:61868 length:1548 start_codon:yes stop_codon:yes gene_type:complete
MAFRFLTLVICISFFSCKKEKPLVPTSIEKLVLIPIPDQIVAEDYGFLFDQETRVMSDTLPEVQAIATQFKNLLKQTPFPLTLDNEVDENVVSFNIVSSDSIPSPEGYVLAINNKRLSLAGSTPSGVFRGMQTLLQVLPDALIAGKQIDSLIIPGLKIVDEPQYEYRGMMLDVARHFFTVDEVKRLIDQMALYKLNKLHLHLTDDQGWRVEIKSWPKLTEIGGSSSVRNERPGFYTQEDYKSIVAYAQSKYITVIPEIDMPGHTNAALASYPELNCNGKATKLYKGMRVGFSTLCVDKDITYTFVEDVIKEIAAMTPGPYIHLGGDESHVTSKKDYNIFLNKVFSIVKKYKKQVIGWEEIESAGVDSTYIVQHWQRTTTASRGLAQGAKVILSPAKRMYLDMKYTKKSPIGLTWAGTVEVDSAYIWKPSQIFKDVPPSQVLGVESPLWSETIKSSDDIEYLAFPRLIGHAELGWSKPENYNWDSYKRRLYKHYKRMDILKINYYNSPVLETKIKP